MSKKSSEIPMAGNILEPGNAREYKTGGWRAERPKHNPEDCLWIKNGTCALCCIFCPDNAIKLSEKDGKFLYAYDYDYCKGCGICANECPKSCITMEAE
ncbi:MAG: hypothetical protein C4K49_08535 [Candidatus Thorarchaeota archaeon]|nr:MAG: hypothetical protein C4K49_08535 [Candidatus Thorarchaeota archaeon]